MNRGAWQATVHGIARVRHDLATKPAPRLKKEPEVSNRDINGLLDKGSYSSEARSSSDSPSLMVEEEVTLWGKLTSDCYQGNQQGGLSLTTPLINCHSGAILI